MHADALTPVELLAALKERYDPGMDLEQMIQWYKDELEKADL